jgi:hypothetical protein
MASALQQMNLNGCGNLVSSSACHLSEAKNLWIDEEPAGKTRDVSLRST